MDGNLTVRLYKLLKNPLGPIRTYVKNMLNKYKRADSINALMKWIIYKKVGRSSVQKISLQYSTISDVHNNIITQPSIQEFEEKTGSTRLVDKKLPQVVEPLK